MSAAPPARFPGLPAFSNLLRVVLFSGRERSAELAQVAGLGLTLLIWATCGDDLLSGLDSSSLVFIDWLLPCCTALECCRLIRSRQELQDTHVTVLLEHGDEAERRDALKAGADDYLVGQSSLPEILRRAGVCASGRCVGPTGGTLAVGPFELKEEACYAAYRGTRLDLNPAEFRLLRRLATDPGKALRRSELVAAIGGPNSGIREHRAEIWIAQLRRGLASVGASHHVRTVPGEGYALDLG